MNCDDCREHLSLYLDNELEEVRAVAVRGHVAVCAVCAKLLEDLSSIMFTCGTEDASELVPPNSQALWCRISNTIESEIKPAPVETASKPRFWSLSLPQLASAVLCVAILSSLLTVITVRNYLQPPQDDFTSRATATQTTFEKVLGKVGLMETPERAHERHIKEQMAAISYWNDRVQTRRNEWDTRTREAFDRNLQVIDRSLNQYSVILQQDPDDELSVEMLDSVMNDKMNLLRDFSDL